MRRDFEAYLWDMHECGMDIMTAVQGRTLDEYLADRNLRRMVERNFEIIGEAIKQVELFYPNEPTGISDARDIVAFRNRLAYGYFSGEDGVVWNIIGDSLPRFIAEVSVTLDEWHQG